VGSVWIKNEIKITNFSTQFLSKFNPFDVYVEYTRYEKMAFFYLMSSIFVM